MKKVLILAYDYPPYVSVGGLRPYNWYKYLKEFGVYPIVVTRQWSNEHGNFMDYIAPSESDETITERSEQGTIIRTPFRPNFANKLMLKYGDSKYAFLRKTISAYYEFIQFFFLIGPKSIIYYTAEEYLKKNPVDAIIATGDPYILFSYASKLSKTFNTPWIADYRDPWSQNRKIEQNFLLKNINSFLEKRTTHSSFLITTVSSYLQIKISSLVKNKKILIIPNGYDPEALENIKSIPQQSDVLNIAIIGTIYTWHPVRSCLSVISQFIKDKKDVKLKLNFYGINITSELNRMLVTDFPDLKNYVFIYPKTPNDILMQKLAAENIML